MLFGSGEDDILRPFQIGFTGAVFFGLLHMVLADHPGGVGRRDALGIACGLAGASCSGVGLVMSAVTAAVVLLRRGERAFLLHTIPTAVFLSVWSALDQPLSDRPFGGGVGLLLEWAVRGLSNPIEGLAGSQRLAIGLGALVVLGLAIAAVRSGTTFWRELAVPLVMAGASGVFMLSVAPSRSWSGIASSASTRYVYVCGCLVLPAIGLAAHALMTVRWRPGLGVLALLLIGVPSNLDKLTSEGFYDATWFDNLRQTVLGLPRSPDFAEASDGVRFLPIPVEGLDVGWLRRAAANGELPDPGPIDPAVSAQFPLILGLAHRPPLEEPQDIFCFERTEAFDFLLKRGDQIRLYSDVYLIHLVDGQEASPPVLFRPSDGNGVMSVETDMIDVRAVGAFNVGPFTVCQLESR